MKKNVLIMLTIALALGLLTGCAGSSEQDVSDASFEEKIVAEPYEASILGYDIDVQFEPDGTGTASTDDMEVSFKYTISDIDGNKAKVTVTGTGISEVDGQSADVEFIGNDMKVKYSGMSYVLKPEGE